MSDRARELAELIMTNTMEPRLYKAVVLLVRKWDLEDVKPMPPAPLTLEEEYDRYF